MPPHGIAIASMDFFLVSSTLCVEEVAGFKDGDFATVTARCRAADWEDGSNDWGHCIYVGQAT